MNAINEYYQKCQRVLYQGSCVEASLLFRQFVEPRLTFVPTAGVLHPICIGCNVSKTIPSMS